MFYTPTFTYSNDKSVNCSLAEWQTDTPLFWGYIFSVIFWFRSIGKRERNIYSLLWNVEISSRKWVGQSVKDIKKTTLISLNRNLAMMSTIGWYNIITRCKTPFILLFFTFFSFFLLLFLSPHISFSPHFFSPFSLLLNKLLNVLKINTNTLQNIKSLFW